METISRFEPSRNDKNLGSRLLGREPSAGGGSGRRKRSCVPLAGDGMAVDEADAVLPVSILFWAGRLA